MKRIFKNVWVDQVMKLSKKEELFVCFSFVLAVAIIITTVLLLNNNTKRIKGAAKGTCDIWMTNLKTTSATVNWKCNGTSVSSLTIYTSDSSGNAKKDLLSNNPSKSDEQVGSYNVTKKISAGNYYLASIKTKNKTYPKRLFSTSFYKIVYQSNGASGNIAGQNINFLVKTKLNKNSYKKDYYDFNGWVATRTVNGKKQTLGYDKNNKSGWYLKPNKTRILKDQYEVQSLSGNNTTVYMTAQWKENAKSPTYLRLKCPTKVKVNTKFECTVREAGIKISATSKNLSGYDATFTTTSKDLKKQYKYTYPQSILVTATKKPYEKMSTWVEIVDENYGKNYIKYENGFVYYSQHDYKRYPFGSHTVKNVITDGSKINSRNISTSGCGTTAMAMVLSTLLKDNKYNPARITNDACRINNYCSGNGTDSGYFAYASGKFKINYVKYEKYDDTNVKKMLDVISSGGIGMLAGKASGAKYADPFTGGGHFVVIRKLVYYDKNNVWNSRILLGDPNTNSPYYSGDNLKKSKLTSTKEYKLSDLKDNLDGMYSFKK